MEDKTKVKKSCWFFSYIIFVINLLVAGLVVLGIKHKDEENLVSESVSSDSEFSPVQKSVLEAQNNISTDRENKLRDLNTEPKELKQVDTTTTTTTTTTVVEEQKADTSTRSS